MTKKLKTENELTLENKLKVPDEYSFDLMNISRMYQQADLQQLLLENPDAPVMTSKGEGLCLEVIQMLSDLKNRPFVERCLEASLNAIQLQLQFIGGDNGT